MYVEEACATWHFRIILISLRVEVAQILDFLVQAKILPLGKACFDFKFTTLYTREERHNSYFFIS